MKSSAVPATLFCTALMLAPLCGGAGSAKATTAIAQQTGIVKGTVVDANGEAVIEPVLSSRDRKLPRVQ